MDVNQAIVKILESSGKADYVFGSTGQVNASMMLALKDSKTIKTVVVRNEQAASFMACGYTMFNPENLGVCFATGGPGAFNLFQGMAVAYSDSLPILAITGYTSMGSRGKGALNESTGLGRTPDSQTMFSCTSKKSFIVEDASQICDIMEEAITLAFDGRPGPVHVHIPKDISIAEVKDFRYIHPVCKEYRPADGVCREAAMLIAKDISNGKKPAVLVGYGAVRSGAKEEILYLVEKYNMPFFSTMDAKGYLPENHRLSAGVLGTSGDPLAKEIFNQSGVVIAVGNSFAENATFAFKNDLYNGKDLIHINIDKHELGKVYQPAVAVYSDAKTALKDINKELGIIFEGSDICSYYKVLDKSKKRINMPLEPVKTAGTMSPAEVSMTISEVAPKNAIIMGDAGSHMLWLSSYMSLNDNQRYQNPGSFGPMASHTNGCMGVQCANPDKVVISGSGDGCYMMAGFELLTAVENNIPVIWVIFRNGEFNVIKKFLINMFGEYAYMGVPSPDYMKYAESCGAKGYSVHNKEELKKALEDAIALRKPAIIDVPVDGEIYPPMSISKV